MSSYAVNQQLRRDFKRPSARGHFGEPCQRRLGIPVVGFDHEGDAEKKQRAGAGMSDDAEHVVGPSPCIITPIV